MHKVSDLHFEQKYNYIYILCKNFYHQQVKQSNGKLICFIISSSFVRENHRIFFSFWFFLMHEERWPKLRSSTAQGPWLVNESKYIIIFVQTLQFFNFFSACFLYVYETFLFAFSFILSCVSCHKNKQRWSLPCVTRKDTKMLVSAGAYTSSGITLPWEVFVRNWRCRTEYAGDRLGRRKLNI